MKTTNLKSAGNTTTTERSVLTLLTLMSPSFPIGSFSYSHGIETAVQSENIKCSADAQSWIRSLLQYGSGYTDSLFCSFAWREPEPKKLHELIETHKAMATSKERYEEAILQGKAFCTHANIWRHLECTHLDPATPYSIVVGVISKEIGIPLELTLTAYLQTFASNLLQALLRLGVLGQTESTKIQNSLEPSILSQAKFASKAKWDDLSNHTFHSEIMAMQHENLNSRIFKS